LCCCVAVLMFVNFTELKQRPGLDEPIGVVFQPSRLFA
jgi:hypothetical protein